MELQLRNLSARHHDGTVAIADISFDAPVGVCGILGGAGAGKTTLLRVLAGAQPALRGSVARLGDIDLLSGSDAARRAVGLLPQAFASTCKAGADEVLNHHAVLKGIPGYQARRDIVDALLQQVGLWEARRQAPGTFSPGMLQRFGLAIALLGRPPLLLLDAPAAGMDEDEHARMRALIATLGQHHVVLLATRDGDDVASTCARRLVLDGGRVCAALDAVTRREDAARKPPAAAA